MNFKDKIILITGAASGIGRAAAVAFAKAGGTIIVSDINEKGGTETVALIEAGKRSSHFYKNKCGRFCFC